MKDQFYGDHRDVVKWGTLLELARRLRLKHILQVLYYRKNEWGQIEVDGERVNVAKEALRHFRDSTAIRNISKEVSVEVLAEEFGDRLKYLELIMSAIRSREAHPGIVFLDPDTGLQPKSGKLGPTHVSEKELSVIWKTLHAGDLLVFYQHQDNRAGMEWKERKRLQLAGALGIGEARTARVKLAHAPSLAHDVAFFFIKKD